MKSITRNRWLLGVLICLTLLAPLAAQTPELYTKWENFTPANGMPDAKMLSVAVDGGRVWAGTENGLVLIEESKVVKIFNTTGANNMANPLYQNERIPMLYCGDDAGAKSVAAQLASDAGMEPVDAGGLRNSRLLEPYAMLWIYLAYRGGFGREFAFKLVRR